MPKLSNRLPSYTLEDGTEIKSSAMSGCGWRGVALNPWCEDLPFIAMLSPGWVETEGLSHLLEGFNSTSLMIHMGWYADEREAAYVSALAQDPEWMEFMLENYQQMNSHRETPSGGDIFTDFPADLYKQPVNLTAAEAYALTKQTATEKNVGSKKASKTLTKSEKSARRSNAKNKAVVDARAKALAEMPAWLRALAPENS